MFFFGDSKMFDKWKALNQSSNLVARKSISLKKAKISIDRQDIFPSQTLFCCYVRKKDFFFSFQSRLHFKSIFVLSSTDFRLNSLHRKMRFFKSKRFIEILLSYNAEDVTAPKGFLFESLLISEVCEWLIVSQKQTNQTNLLFLVFS